jgi:hypothetical protein
MVSSFSVHGAGIFKRVAPKFPELEEVIRLFIVAKVYLMADELLG